MDVDWDSLPFQRRHLEEYMTNLLGETVEVTALHELRGEEPSDQIKGFGYGVPLLVQCRCAGREQRFVLHTVSRDGFGHERRSDRASNLLLDHATFDSLPRHVGSVDVGAFSETGQLISLGDAGEFFHLTRYGEGKLYAADLHRICESGELARRDVDRALGLADYLADIHAVQTSDPLLYRRRVRDLVGHGEGIMGILDGFPSDFDLAPVSQLEAIEKLCVTWRWRIKDHVHRLSQVHGDFHPWNILFREGSDFILLDRSRGAWGEPADDLSSMTVNFLFFSLRRSESLSGPFTELYELFWERYLALTDDWEVLSVIQPFYAWRALVLASPVWYPDLSDRVRRALLRFVERVLEVERYEPGAINNYLV